MNEIRRKTTTYDKNYIQGNTVRKQAPQRTLREVNKPSQSAYVRRNREKAQYMNLGYACFLMVALVVSGMIMVNYIELRSAITSGTSQITTLESSLNAKIRANNEEITRLESSIDLEYIKGVALYELGMTYASSEQIITYEDNKIDYVRQYADIPK